MTTRTLALMFAAAAIVAAAALAAIDQAAIAFDEPQIVMPAAEPFVVTAAVSAPVFSQAGDAGTSDRVVRSMVYCLMVTGPLLALFVVIFLAAQPITAAIEVAPRPSALVRIGRAARSQRHDCRTDLRRVA